MAHYRPARRLPSSLYVKDVALFSQKITYSKDGMSWDATPCCYCGDPATEEEHVFPLGALNKLRGLAHIQIPADLLRIVPACGECNRLAGGKVFHSFEDKRTYIKWKIMSRYGKVLNMPYWHPEEIAELRGRLHTWIDNGQGIRGMIFERLRF